MAVVITKDAVAATNLKKEIGDCGDADTKVIGFTISTEEDEDDYEDDE